jgi:hypothetical protein
VLNAPNSTDGHLLPVMETDIPYPVQDGAMLVQSMYEASSEDPEDDEALESIGDWTLVSEYETKILHDDVDARLLHLAKREMRVVADRMREKFRVVGADDNGIQNYTPAQHFDVWFTPPIASAILSFVNRNLTEQRKPLASNEEILAFLQAELMMSFYSKTPTIYFDPTYRLASDGGISKKRYVTILKALSDTPPPAFMKRGHGASQ